jgi:GxxExxY protein
MKYEELTEKIIGCAFRVYNELGFGFLESVYEKALIIELKSVRLDAVRQTPLTVYYKGENVGDFVADVIAEREIIIELKSVSALARAHEVQLVNYLKATKKDIGLLINFGETGVAVRRKIRELPSADFMQPEADRSFPNENSNDSA